MIRRENTGTTRPRENYLALGGLPPIKGGSWWGRDDQAGYGQIGAALLANRDQGVSWLGKLYQATIQFDVLNLSFAEEEEGESADASC